jgi:peptidylprolyl isomerase
LAKFFDGQSPLFHPQIFPVFIFSGIVFVFSSPFPGVKRKEKVMAKAKNGDSVKVHYTGKLEDGTVFDTSDEKKPLQFTLGEGKLIKGFEAAVIGMEPGELKTVQIPADKAYGPHHPEMVMVIDRKEMPPTITPRVDQMLQVRQKDGTSFAVKVTKVSEETLTLDANHPLAGKDLTFDIRLAEIA